MHSGELTDCWLTRARAGARLDLAWADGLTWLILGPLPPPLVPPRPRLLHEIEPFPVPPKLVACPGSYLCELDVSLGECGLLDDVQGRARLANVQECLGVEDAAY